MGKNKLLGKERENHKDLGRKVGHEEGKRDIFKKIIFEIDLL